MKSPLSYRALCDVDDVVSYAPGYTTDEPTEATLIRLINAQSRRAYGRTGRQFIPTERTQPATRSFRLTVDDVRERVVPIDDLATTDGLQLEIRLVDGTLVETVSSAAVIALPENREEWEPITELELPAGATSPANLAAGRVLRVTGTWGFPLVPDDIREAVAKLVIVRYVSDVAAVGTALADALQSLDLRALFEDATSTIDAYRVPVCA